MSTEEILNTEDLTNYGENELTLRFQNDENLYSIWEDAQNDEEFKTVKENADLYFSYSDEQIETLLIDFIDELIEKEDNKLYKTVWDMIKDSGYDTVSSFIDNVLQSGCVSGMVSGLIYYAETCKFYEEHKTEIWDLCLDLSDELGNENVFDMLKDCNGVKNIGSAEQFENFMAWLSFEEVARRIQRYYED